MAEKKRQPGGRSAKGYVQITFRVPDDLRRHFKAAAALEDRDMSEIIEALIVDYLKRRKPT